MSERFQIPIHLSEEGFKSAVIDNLLSIDATQMVILELLAEVQSGNDADKKKAKLQEYNLKRLKHYNDALSQLRNEGDVEKN
jgi:energy-converting hydrogenase A subunit M